MRPDAHRLGNLIFRQAFRPGEVLSASAVALRRPPIGHPIFRQAFRPGEVLGASAVALRFSPIGRPDFPSGLPPRRGAGSVGRCAPTPTDWATRFFVRPFAPARCWERRPLRSDAYRLGDLTFRQAFRPCEVQGASAVALRRPPIGRPDFSSGLPPRRGAGSVDRCAPTPTDWAT